MTFILLPKNTPIIKRILDLVLTLLALIILSPVLIIISLMVVIWHGFPIFFKQKRPGYHGEVFTLYKFRTMGNLTDDNGELLSDAKRMTKFGRFLRATSLDELPELFNVLKGEMSLVGPRPLLIEYLPLYTHEQFRRHNVLPGITGWAQVHGRNVLTWEEKFSLDVWYVKNWSFWLDIKILAMTIIKVIQQEGISQPGQATAKPFTGTSEKPDPPAEN